MPPFWAAGTFQGLEGENGRHAPAADAGAAASTVAEATHRSIARKLRFRPGQTIAPSMDRPAPERALGGVWGPGGGLGRGRHIPAEIRAARGRHRATKNRAGKGRLCEGFVRPPGISSPGWQMFRADPATQATPLDFTRHIAVNPSGVISH